jgi:alpha-tubulin suppressor-like RCC1 family protein
VAGLINVATLASGGNHSLALRSDGTVWAWGSNSQGQLGDGTDTDRLTPVQVPGLTDFTALAAGDAHSLAVRRDGAVWAWGSNFYGQLGDGTTSLYRLAPAQVSRLTNITALAAGSTRSLALRSDGTLSAWGANGHGQLGDGTAGFSPVPLQVLLQ